MRFLAETSTKTVPSSPRRPLFGNQAAIGQLLLDAVGIGFGLVDLVDGHDDGHVGGLGVVDGLEGLRHHAVVGGDHDDHNVGDLGAAGSHAGKGFVARSIEEDDLAAVRPASLPWQNFTL